MTAKQIFWVNDQLDCIKQWIDALPDYGQAALCGALFLVGALLPVALGF